jgi:hypothetical protein
MRELFALTAGFLEKKGAIRNICAENFVLYSGVPKIQFPRKMWDFRVGAAFWSAETDSFPRLFLQDEDEGEGLSASAQL